MNLTDEELYNISGGNRTDEGFLIVNCNSPKCSKYKSNGHITSKCGSCIFFKKSYCQLNNNSGNIITIDVNSYNKIIIN